MEGGDSNCITINTTFPPPQHTISRQHFISQSHRLEGNPGVSFVTALTSGAPKGAVDKGRFRYPRAPSGPRPWSSDLGQVLGHASRGPAPLDCLLCSDVSVLTVAGAFGRAAVSLDGAAGIQGCLSLLTPQT